MIEPDDGYALPRGGMIQEDLAYHLVDWVELCVIHLGHGWFELDELGAGEAKLLRSFFLAQPEDVTAHLAERMCKVGEIPVRGDDGEGLNPVA